MRKFIRMVVCLLLAVGIAAMPVSAMAKSKVKIVQLLKVTEDRGRLREGPSNQYDVIRSLREGERVFYLGMQNSFAKVRTSKGEVGYIYKGFLSAYGAVRMDQVYYATKSTRVYKSASTSARRLGTLSKSTHVIVYKTRGNWAMIKSLTGTTGYAKLSDLKRVA